MDETTANGKWLLPPKWYREWANSQKLPVIIGVDLAKPDSEEAAYRDPETGQIKRMRIY